MKRYTESSLFRPLDRGARVTKMRKGVANNSTQNWEEKLVQDRLFQSLLKNNMISLPIFGDCGIM